DASSTALKERKFDAGNDASLGLVARCLTGRRLEVLRCIARRRQSLEEIARETGVHRGFLTDTISLLQSEQIIRVVREGRRKIPELTIDRLVITLREG